MRWRPLNIPSKRQAYHCLNRKSFKAPMTRYPTTSPMTSLKSSVCYSSKIQPKGQQFINFSRCQFSKLTSKGTSQVLLLWTILHTLLSITGMSTSSTSWKFWRKERQRRRRNRQLKIKLSKPLKQWQTWAPTSHLPFTCESTTTILLSSLTSIRSIRRSWPRMPTKSNQKRHFLDIWTQMSAIDKIFRILTKPLNLLWARLIRVRKLLHKTVMPLLPQQPTDSKKSWRESMVKRPSTKH